MKRRMLAAALTALTAMSVLVWPRLASAAPFVWEVHNIGYLPQKICLDADNSTLGQNGTVVQVWECNGWLNQAWAFEPVPDQPGFYTIRNLGHDKCLDADTGTIGRQGAVVQMWDCNGWKNQQWRQDFHNFRNAVSGQCLDVKRKIPNQPPNGTVVDLWDCQENSAYQAW